MAGSSKSKLEHYECEGQLSIFDFIKPVCNYSGHTCNKAELWKVADTLDDLMCPHVCCRKCNTKMCGARCNGSQEPEPFMNEPVYELNIRGLQGRNGEPMSEENGKVCCNCRHNIRIGGKINFVTCRCDIDGSWLSYITVMTHWCRHWSRDKAESEDKE